MIRNVPGAEAPSGPTGLPITRDGNRSAAVEARYRPLFVVGTGGMGRVEVAIERGVDGAERLVALKRLLPEGALDPRRKQMFLREARLAALLRHPNVVHAYAFGELDGELFMAMEYVEGEPLSRVLAAAARIGHGRLDPALVAYVLAEACAGLDAAHELCDPAGRALNVVHRDVSPHNVMIAYEGHVKILDFGVAKLDVVGSTQTRTGEVKGKMAYMSPEQALGEKLDRRSDLFSVGAVMFECLAGTRMWGSGTELELMRKIALERPPSLDRLVPEVPAALAHLQARLVARNPSERPSSARDVAGELRAFAMSRPDPPSATSVQAFLLRLFGDQAEGRRAQLTAALEVVTPTRAAALRRSLQPGAALDRPTLTEAVVVSGGGETPSDPPMDRTPRRRARRAMIATAALIGIGIAGLGATGMTRSPHPAVHPPVAPATLTALPVATPDPTPTGAPTSTQAATPGLVPTAPPKTSASPTPAAIHPRPRSTPFPSVKHPDVDPTPF